MGRRLVDEVNGDSVALCLSVGGLQVGELVQGKDFAGAATGD